MAAIEELVRAYYIGKLSKDHSRLQPRRLFGEGKGHVFSTFNGLIVTSAQNKTMILYAGQYGRLLGEKWESHESEWQRDDLVIQRGREGRGEAHQLALIHMLYINGNNMEDPNFGDHDLWPVLLYPSLLMGAKIVAHITGCSSQSSESHCFIIH